MGVPKNGLDALIVPGTVRKNLEEMVRIEKARGCGALSGEVSSISSHERSVLHDGSLKKCCEVRGAGHCASACYHA